MKITTIPQSNDWQVRAVWFGAERIVFTGTVFECINFVNSND